MPGMECQSGNIFFAVAALSGGLLTACAQAETATLESWYDNARYTCSQSAGSHGFNECMYTQGWDVGNVTVPHDAAYKKHRKALLSAPSRGIFPYEEY